MITSSKIYCKRIKCLCSFLNNSFPCSSPKFICPHEQNNSQSSNAQTAAASQRRNQNVSLPKTEALKVLGEELYWVYMARQRQRSAAEVASVRRHQEVISCQTDGSTGSNHRITKISGWNGPHESGSNSWQNHKLLLLIVTCFVFHDVYLKAFIVEN